MIRSRLAGYLSNARRHPEAVALLEKAVKEAKDRPDRRVYLSALRDLHSHLATYITVNTEADAVRAFELLNLILREARGDRDPSWESWARLAYNSVVYSTWVDGRGVYRSTLSHEQRADAMRRLTDVFGWAPYLDVEGRRWLARHYESQGKTAEALAEYRYMVEHPRDIPGTLPDYWDQSVLALNQWHDKRIEARFKIISLSERELGDQKAVAGYRAIVRDYGLAHHRGPSIAEVLMRLGGGTELGFPPRAALLIGGGFNGLISWSNVLRPMGFAVHPRSQYVHTAANLAPYDLVVLAPQGGIALQPSEILALRSYVATGGSLLVIASPGWDHATPTILNPLLSFFDVRAGDELVVGAQSTEVADHPITRGISSAMIKNANHLDAPRGLYSSALATATSWWRFPSGRGGS